MTPPTHAATGLLLFLSLKSWLEKRGFPVTYTNGIGLTTVIFSLIPDIDVFWMGLHQHRLSLLHTPIFWLMVTLVVIAFSYIIRRRFLRYASLFAFAAILLHLLADTINPVVGVRLLYPLSHHSYYLDYLTQAITHPISRLFYFSFFVIDELIILFFTARLTFIHYPHINRAFRPVTAYLSRFH